MYKRQFCTKPPTGANIDEVMYARLHYGLLMDKLGQGAKVGQHWKETIQFYEKSKASGTPMGTVAPAAIAQIRFILAEPQFQAFMALKINGPGEKKMRQKDIAALLKKPLAETTKARLDTEKPYPVVVRRADRSRAPAPRGRQGTA